jgi:hypothetical protein
LVRYIGSDGKPISEADRGKLTKRIPNTMNIRFEGTSSWGELARWLCTNCKIPPEARHALKTGDGLHVGSGLYTTDSYGILPEEARKLRIVNDDFQYVPYDKNWIDQFPEIKRITPFSENYYDTTPTRSEKEFQDELNKIKAAEPLQILNQVQHIEPEPVPSETPIQEKSFIDKNKNYLIIGGVAITALILILVVRK